VSSVKTLQELSDRFVLSIDPGKTTGWVHAHVDMKDVMLISRGCVNEWGGLDALIGSLQISVIVIEGFFLRLDLAPSMANKELITPQVVGVVKYIGEQAGIPVVVQRPSEGKNADHLALVKFGSDVRNRHQRSAAAHLLAYAHKNGLGGL